jgi:hypothetical protein
MEANGPIDDYANPVIAAAADSAPPFQFRKRIAFILTAILTIIMIAQFGKIIDNASPSLVDDPAIIRALGQKNSPNLSDVWADLKTIPEYREFLQNGSSSRFRPAYYPFRAAAIYLLGNDFRLWYLVTFVMYAATSAELFSMVMRSFGALSAGLFLILYLGHKAWSDLIPRLGPIEIQCMFFITILVWLLWNWIELGKRWSLALAVPLLFLVAMMKEPNSVYLIYLGGLLLVCGLLVGNRRMMSTALALFAAGSIVLAILFRWTGPTSRAGLVSLSGPLHDYVELAGRDSTRWVVFVLFGVLLGGLFAEAAGYLKKTSWRELLAMLAALLSVEVLRLVIFYISYSTSPGTNPIETRYGYPFFLIQALIVAIVIGRLLVLLGPVSSSRATTIKGLAIACVLGLLLINHGLFARQVFALTDVWVNFNSDTESTINDAAATLLREHGKGNHPVLIASGPALDFEPHISLVQYLRRAMPSTIIYVDRSEPGTEAQSLAMAEVGGTMVSPAEKRELMKSGCIDVHVDLKPYNNPDCVTLAIVMGRTAGN